ncbi:MAG: cobalamin-binding protein, partial [Pirellulales bacterium]
MRIVSLLPSATEIVADLGLLHSLVGRSHECQWPAGVRAVPAVAASRIDSAALDGRPIDEAVRAAVEEGEALYVVDGELLAALRPEVIITQDLCRVCAVAGEDFGGVGARVITLGPRTLEEVAESVRYLGRE